MERRDDNEVFKHMFERDQMLYNGCGTQMCIAVAIFVIMLFSSCATKTKVEYKDRIVDHYITNTVHDTLVDKTTDSVYVNVYTRNDTVFQVKYKEKTRWRDHIVIKHDTCRVDSIITIRKEVTKEVVKYPKSYRYLLVFSILVVIFAIYKGLRWLKEL